MKEQKDQGISFYVRQYTLLSHKADNAITLIEMGQPEKAKELLKFALMRAEAEFLDIADAEEEARGYCDALDADYPE